MIARRVSLSQCGLLKLSQTAFFVLLAIAAPLQVCATVPLGTPDRDDIEYPDDEPPSDDEIKLGKQLFFDTRLSKNKQVSCATCHDPNLGFGDGQEKSLGTDGKKLPRHSPHLYNLAWSAVFFWDGRAASLEEQVLMPITDKKEMDLPLDQLTKRLTSISGYRTAFKQVYRTTTIQPEHIAKALAAFSRTIITDNSAFDRYLAGDSQALSPAAQRGLILFKGKAECHQCHDGPNFTDDSFHSLGIDDKDLGRGTIMPNAGLENTFKTPGLRNITLTAPYMHDGSIGDLESVIHFYNDGGGKARHKDKLITPLNLNDHEIAELLAFLGALTDPIIIRPPNLPE